MAAGGVFVLVLIIGLVLLTRAGKPANTSAGDPNLAKLQVSGLHMATAENFAGGSVTYIEGKLTNGYRSQSYRRKRAGDLQEFSG